jgi:hypothetical protein
MSANPTRQADELLLDWLRLRAEGKTSVEVAAIYGVTQERVRSATSRVVDEDIDHSGETEKAVLAGYWPRKRRKTEAEKARPKAPPRKPALLIRDHRP